jgi:hypothetical protein
MADALCWILASRCQILDLLELEEKGPQNPVVAEGLVGWVSFFSDLCQVQVARAAGEVGRISAELVFGYRRHPRWDTDARGCFPVNQVEQLEGTMPGITAGASQTGDVVAEDGSHAEKAGPCVSFDGLETFTRLRTRLDGCLSGSRLAKDRAAAALTEVMIPEALDYPT